MSLETLISKTVVMEITDVCKNNCTFCYSLSFTPKKISNEKIKHSNFEKIKKGILGFKEYGIEQVYLSGGEPTLHPNFTEILEYAKSIDMKVIVYTDGSTFQNEKVRGGIQNYADCVSVSIHAYNKQIHNKIKGRKESYDEAILSLNNYIKTCEKVKVNTVVCKDNLDYVAEIGDLLDIENSEVDWKVTKVLIEKNSTHHKKTLDIEDEEFNNLEKEIKEKYPIAYSSGRIRFRRQSETFEPYIVVRCDGEIHIPKGKDSVYIGVNICERNFQEKLYENIKKVIE